MVILLHRYAVDSQVIAGDSRGLEVHPVGDSKSPNNSTKPVHSGNPDDPGGPPAPDITSRDHMATLSSGTRRRVDMAIPSPTTTERPLRCESDSARAKGAFMDRTGTRGPARAQQNWKRI